MNGMMCGSYTMLHIMSAAMASGSSKQWRWGPVSGCKYVGWAS